MRPTGLGSGAYQDNVDYNVFSGEWLIGRMPGRRGRSWKRSPEPNLGPPCAAMICRPPVAMAYFVTKDYLRRPSGLPDGIVIRH
jgi:hypothetical protein